MNVSSLLRSSAALLAMGVLSSVGQAQVLTEDTITPSFSGAASFMGGAYLTNGNAYTQTFSVITSIDALTVRFLAADTKTFAATDLTYYFSEWSTGTNMALGAGPISTGLLNLADSGSWTNLGDGYNIFDATLDLSAFTLSASSVYAFTVVGNAVTSGNVDFAQGTGSAPYAGGNGFQTNGVSSFGDLSSIGATDRNYDFAFTAGSSSPVPEASTAAVLFAGVFVGGLMVRRRRRQPADALPVAQA